MKTENRKLKKYKLNQIADILAGGTPSTKDVNYWNGDIPWLSVKDFSSTNKWVSSTEKTITQEGFDNCPASMLQKGDLILSARGTVGKVAMVDKNMAFNQSCFGLRANRSLITPDFLFYWFINNQQIFKGAQQGNVFKSVTLDFFDKTSALITPLESQQKIAAVLSALDDKIALNRRMNAKLEQMAKRLYVHWFVQFDFPNEKGKPYKSSGGKMVWNEVLKREIPAGWEVKRLGEFLDCNKNSMSSESDYKYINYLDTSSLTENLINGIAKIHQDYPSRAKRIVCKNDILFSTVRPAQHHFGMIKKPVKNMIASTGFAILSCKYGSEYNEFFYQFITSTENIEKLDSIANLNASSYPSINSSDILDLKITLPHEISELKPFIDKVSAIFELVDSRQRETQKLTSLRDRLLPLLMNGQVEVK